MSSGIARDRGAEGTPVVDVSAIRYILLRVAFAKASAANGWREFREKEDQTRACVRDSISDVFGRGNDVTFDTAAGGFAEYSVNAE